MKKNIFIIALLLISSMQAFSVNIETEPIKKSETSLERDKFVGLDSRCIENNIYFNLKMQNESKGGFYSLVREYPDGSFESVEIKDIAVNTINTPILYSFNDKDIPKINFRYVLYRVSIESEEVQSWQYCSKKKTICPEVDFVVD